MGTKLLIRPNRSHVFAVTVDATIVAVMYYIVLNFRYAGGIRDFRSWTVEFAVFAAAAVIVHITVGWFTGVYSIVSRYMSLTQAVRLGQAGLVSVAILFVLVLIWPLVPGTSGYLVPRTVVLGGGLATIIVMIAARFSWRVYFETLSRPDKPTERLLLVGAGQAADMLLREIKRTPSLNAAVAGLLDDRNDLQNMSIQGYPVLGRVSDAPAVVEKCDVTQIVVAIPSATAEEILSIYRQCKPAGVPMKVLPSLTELVSGTVSLRDARDLDIKDLLGRPVIETDVGAISDYVQGHTVLVTGGGGSIGSELCRQIAEFSPRRLVVVDHDESSLYDLHEQLMNKGFRHYTLYPASIRHERKLDKIFALHRPRLVFHAAAYKHVPLMELSPDEAVLTNVKGTYIVAETAARYGVERFVNISTDKAVEPCNVMGATKRAGELIMRLMAERYPETSFASVRFGNVLGSQGSVIPIFRSQIKAGGPLTITHPDMTRYFMLIEEAVQLVIQAAVLMDENGSGGEGSERDLNTFLLDMGNPVSIVDLAQRLIDFYWKDNGRSLGVEFSGLRPGEKLEESLTYPFEEAQDTSHPLVKRVALRSGVRPYDGHGAHFERQLRGLLEVAETHGDRRVVTGALRACLPDYCPLDAPGLEKSVVIP